MNAYDLAVLSNKRFGVYLIAFTELIGKDNITQGIIDGMTNTMDIDGYKNFVSFNDEFKVSMPDDTRFNITVDIPKEGYDTLQEDFFDVNKYFPVSMNTRKTIGILFGDELCCAVTGYDVKHELYVVRFDNVEYVPRHLVEYPAGGHLAYVATAKDLAQLNFNVAIVVMDKFYDEN